MNGIKSFFKEFNSLDGKTKLFLFFVLCGILFIITLVFLMFYDGYTEAKQEREMMEQVEEAVQESMAKKYQERKEGKVEHTEDKMEKYANTLGNNLEGQAKVEHNWIKKEFIIIPTSSGLIDIINDYGLRGQRVSEWDEFVTATQQLSNGAINTIGEGYSFNVVNPNNHKKVILKIEDGVVLFSF